MISSLYLHSRVQAKPLRIGVLVDSFEIPRAFRQVLTDIEASDFARLELVVVNREPVTKAAAGGLRRYSRLPLNPYGRHALLYALYQKFDERQKIQPDPLEAVDCTDLLGDLHRLDIVPERQRFEYRFPADATAALRSYDIDVLLRFGFNILRGEILTAARYGVWSFHYGDNEFYRGGPPLFWEVVEDNPCSGVVLQVLNEEHKGCGAHHLNRGPDRAALRFARVSQELDDGNGLCKALFATKRGLWRRRNAFSPYWGSTHFVIRKLNELHERGWEAVQKDAVPPVPYQGKASPYRVPSNIQMLKWLVPKIGTNLIHRLNPFHREKLDHWRIAIGHAQSSRLLHQHLKEPADYRWVPCPSGRSYGDPFLVEDKGQIWLFFEDYSYGERRGRICCAPVGADLSVGTPTPCMDRPYHLSYPMVFHHCGEVFMIPESSENESVELWRATDFPFIWSLEKTLFRGPLVDTTPIFHEGRWYFFTAIIEPRGRAAFGALFSADELTGEWVHHPRSPISTDVRRARPAGPIQKLGDRLLRPLQDGSENYGCRIHVQEILELTPTTYRERALHSIEPDWEKGLSGVHTYSMCGGIEVLDAAILQDRRAIGLKRS